MTRRYLMDFEADMGNEKTYDCIVVGSGIAGLYTALSIAEDLRVLVVTKSVLSDSNSNLAQGGIAAAMHAEDVPIHIDDTLKAGSAYNDFQAVSVMIEEAHERIHELLDLGIELDCDEEGNLLSTKEGGHSTRRVLHYKDYTGEAVIKGLIEAALKRKNIDFAQHTTAVDILEQDGQAVGILTVHRGIRKVFASRNVVLATGGVGGLYEATTNTGILTGDGLGMALRAQITLKDMEFIQFHPTAYSDGKTTFLISEAVRGEGGHLINSDGERFMEGKHPLKELAPRDVVSRAMFDQILSGKTLYLDVRHLGKDYLAKRFPTIYEKCLSVGYNMAAVPVPVRPVQHYIMGGIETDMKGNTSMQGLYACGETACTGVHGANRLASNSLLEGLVFGKRIASQINGLRNTAPITGTLNYRSEAEKTFDAEAVKSAVRETLTKSAGIIRKKALLERGQAQMSTLLQELGARTVSSEEDIEAYNMAYVAHQVILAACDRSDSLGSHIVY